MNLKIIIIIFLIICYLWYTQQNYKTTLHRAINFDYNTQINKESNKITNIREVDTILAQIQFDYIDMYNIVYMRLALIISLIICLTFYIFLNMNDVAIDNSNYIFLILTSWLAIYWLQNHIFFHYYSPINTKIRNSLENVRSNLRTINP